MAEGSWVYALIQDGIVAGVGAVLGFVPQMLVLFLLLCILEDVGYMARIAFIMDPVSYTHLDVYKRQSQHRKNKRKKE